MKRFKQIDVIGQFLIILTFIGIEIFQRNGTYFMGYLIIGGWQLISVILHLIFRKQLMLSPLRKIYNVVLIVVVALAIIAFTIPQLGLYILLALLYIPTPMALFYNYLCFVELRTINHREFISMR